jgi:hypothetical protein
MSSERVSLFHARTPFEHTIDVSKPERMKVDLSLAQYFGQF